MLDLRPSCEHCASDVRADGPGAFCCSFECTFCSSCAADVFSYVCPNCTGPLLPRPWRPAEHREKAPPSTDRVEKPADLKAHPAKVAAAIARDGRPAHLWEIVVDCGNPPALATFYGDLLGITATTRGEGWAYVEPAPRGPLQVVGGVGGVRIAFQKVPEPRTGKVRLHLDFAAEDLDAFARRAVELGGRRLEDVPDDSSGPFIVLADPEGHEFCVVTP